MKLVKDSILNKIQVAAEVNAALNDYNMVVVTKTQHHDANPVYAIWGCQGKPSFLVDQLIDLDRASP